MSNSNPQIDSDDNKCWHNNQGQLHRIDGPAVEWANGRKEWWVNNKLHCTDGPAVIASDGYKAWYVNGNRHRIDGPAVEMANGYKEYWIDGVRYRTEQEYWNRIKKLGLLQVNRKPRVSRFRKLEIK